MVARFSGGVKRPPQDEWRGPETRPAATRSGRGAEPHTGAAGLGLISRASLEQRSGEAQHWLGISANNVSGPSLRDGETPDPRSKRGRRWQRYYLQSVVRKLLSVDAYRRGLEKPPRTSLCMRAPVDTSGLVEFYLKSDQARARFGNVQTCGSVWACPVCAARITEERRGQLSEAIGRFRARYGGTVVLVTKTLQHSRGDELEALVDVLRDANRRFKQGRAYQGLKHEYGIQAVVSALEVPYGEHGWHPHLHELWFLSFSLSAEQAAVFELLVKQRWQESLERLGGYASWEHGLDVTIAEDDIAAYVSKLGDDSAVDIPGWTAAHELAKAASKRSRADGGRTPYQLLADYADGDEAAGERWLEYYYTMKGKRHMTGLTPLCELVGLEEPASDEDAAADVDERDRLVGAMTLSQWRSLLAAADAPGVPGAAQADVLDALETGGVDAVRLVLVRYGLSPDGLYDAGQLLARAGVGPPEGGGRERGNAKHSGSL